MNIQSCACFFEESECVQDRACIIQQTDLPPHMYFNITNLSFPLFYLFILFLKLCLCYS